MSTLLEAYERWSAVKEEHVPDDACAFPIAGAPFSPERRAAEDRTVDAVLSAVGIGGAEAMMVAKALARRAAAGLLAAAPPREAGQPALVDLGVVFCTAWIDGLGLGASMAARAAEPAGLEVDGARLVAKSYADGWRARAIAAEARVRDLEEASRGACTQLEATLEGLRRTQLADPAEGARDVDADDRLRAAQEADRG